VVGVWPEHQAFLARNFEVRSPEQMTATELASASILKLIGGEEERFAWHYRWNFPENLAFVTKDFGRSFKPQGSDADLQRYGDIIADVRHELAERIAAAETAGVRRASIVIDLSTSGPGAAKLVNKRRRASAGRAHL